LSNNIESRIHVLIRLAAEPVDRPAPVAVDAVAGVRHRVAQRTKGIAQLRWRADALQRSISRRATARRASRGRAADASRGPTTTRDQYALVKEAINLVFEKYGKPPIA
jgi:hypothetical protein